MPCVRAIRDHCLLLARLARSLAMRARTFDAEQAWCARPARSSGMAGRLHRLARGGLGLPERLGLPPTKRGNAVASLANRPVRSGPLFSQELGTAWLAGRRGRPIGSAARPCEALRCSARALLARSAGDLPRPRARQRPRARGDIALAEDEAAAGISVAGLRAEDMLRDSPAPSSAGWEDPYAQPLLRELLAVGIDNRRLRQNPQVWRSSSVRWMNCTAPSASRSRRDDREASVRETPCPGRIRRRRRSRDQ